MDSTESVPKSETSTGTDAPHHENLETEDVKPVDLLIEQEAALTETVLAEVRKWLRVGKHTVGTIGRLLLLVNILAPETALADEIDREVPQEQGVRLRADPDLPPMSEDNQRILASCIPTEASSIGISMIPNDLDIDVQEQEAFITQAMLQEGHPFVFDGVATAINCERNITRDEFPKAGEGWTIKHTSAVSWASKVYVDRYGNKIHTFVRIDNGSQAGFQNISIYPRPPFGPEGSARTLKPLSIDLTPAGLSDLQDVFYEEEVPPVAFAGEFPVYSTDIDAPRAKEIVEPYAEAIKTGIDEVVRWFGQNSDLIEHVNLIDRTSKNASVSPTRPSTIVITSDVLGSYDADSRKPHQDLVTDVTRHEALHALDLTLQITRDNDIQDRLFYGRSKEFLESINESCFRAMEYGGHAAKNELEAFASFMNTLNYRFWEERIDQFSPDLQQEYLEALKAVRSKFAHLKAIPRDAPIFALLDSKIVALTKKLVPL